MIHLVLDDFCDEALEFLFLHAEELIAALGLWLGRDALLFVTMAGIIFGGLSALLLMLLQLKKRKSAFAYGPYFALTALALFMMRSV